MVFADGAEQCRAFLAGGGVGREVHILDHQVYAGTVARQQGQAGFGRGRAQRVDVVQRKQHFQRNRHGGIVVNNQYGRHAASIALPRRAWRGKCWLVLHHALRVASAGEVVAARHAGPYTALMPSAQNTPAPASR